MRVKDISLARCSDYWASDCVVEWLYVPFKRCPPHLMYFNPAWITSAQTSHIFRLKFYSHTLSYVSRLTYLPFHIVLLCTSFLATTTIPPLSLFNFETTHLPTPVSIASTLSLTNEVTRSSKSPVQFMEKVLTMGSSRNTRFHSLLFLFLLFSKFKEKVESSHLRKSHFATFVSCRDIPWQYLVTFVPRTWTVILYEVVIGHEKKRLESA